MQQVSNVRHKARVQLRKEGKPIPKLLEKGVMRDIVAKKPEAIAAVETDGKDQVEAEQTQDDMTPEQHDKEMQDEITQNNRKATDPDGPEMHDKRMNEEMK